MKEGYRFFTRLFERPKKAPETSSNKRSKFSELDRTLLAAIAVGIAGANPTPEKLELSVKDVLAAVKAVEEVRRRHII